MTASPRGAVARRYANAVRTARDMEELAEAVLHAATQQQTQTRDAARVGRVHVSGIRCNWSEPRLAAVRDRPHTQQCRTVPG
jgi:hypothetical protein